MADLFISYSRKDGDFVKRLHGALTGRGRDVWVDWEDIPPSWEWRDELQAGLEKSAAMVFVISPDSLRSPECAIELQRGLEAGKRVIPLLRRDPDGVEVPPELASRNWIFFRDADGFDTGVAKLENALDTDPEWVRDHTRLLARAREWEHRGRDRSLVLRGTDLRQAEEELSGWREGMEPSPTGLQREYVAASRRAAGRRTGTLLGASLVALAVSVLLGVLALVARNDAIDRERDAKSRALAVAGLQRLEADPELATLLAIEAVERGRTPEAEEALRRSVSNVQERAEWRPSRKLTGVDIAPDGTAVAAATSDGRILLRDQRTGRVRLLARHTGYAGVSIDYFGRRAVTYGDDAVLRLHDLRSRRRRDLRVSRGGIVATFSRDISHIVGVEQNGDVRSWDAETARAGPVISAPRGWAGLGLSARGRRIVVSYDDGRVRAFDTRTGARLASRRFGRKNAPTVIAPDGSTAASVMPDSRIAVWDVGTGRIRKTLGGHDGTTVALDFDPRGRTLASGGSDNRVRIWDVAQGRELRELRGHGDTITDVNLSQDGRRVFSESLDGTARSWFTETGEQDSVLREPEGKIEQGVITRDGRFAVTRSPTGRVRVWETTPGRTLRALRHGGTIEAGALHPGGRYAASSGTDRVQFQRVDTGKVRSFPASELTTGPTRDMAFDPAGRRLAVADGSTAFILPVGGGMRWLNHDDAVNSVSWSPDGRVLLTGSADGTVRFLKANDASSELSPRLRHKKAVFEAHFTPDRRRVVSLDEDGTVRVWRLPDRRVIATLPVPGGGTAIAVSPDGRTVAVAGDDRASAALLWRPGTRARPKRLVHRYDVNAVRFSRDGKRLATASDDGTARLWTVASGKPVAVFSGHQDPVTDVDLSRDGRFLLSASGDRTAKLWDVQTERLAGVFGGHDGWVLEARISSGGRRVLTVPEFGAAAVYACDACLPLDDLLRQARRLVGRELTPAERARYLD